MIKCTCR